MDHNLEKLVPTKFYSLTSAAKFLEKLVTASYYF